MKCCTLLFYLCLYFFQNGYVLLFLPSKTDNACQSKKPSHELKGNASRALSQNGIMAQIWGWLQKKLSAALKVHKSTMSSIILKWKKFLNNWQSPSNHELDRAEKNVRISLKLHGQGLWQNIRQESAIAAKGASDKHWVKGLIYDFSMRLRQNKIWKKWKGF